jgi:hypothetical protein
VIVSILPKQLEIKSNAFDGITKDQLAALIAAARNALGIGEALEGGKTRRHTENLRRGRSSQIAQLRKSSSRRLSSLDRAMFVLMASSFSNKV